MKKSVMLSVFAFVSGVLNIQAQEEQNIQTGTNIGEIVIYDQRLQLPESLKNRNLTILTQEQIQQLPVESVNELLAYASGVDLRQRGPFGTQADISIEGGSFEQNLLLLNGQKITDPQTGHNSLNIPVPLEAIERIEIVRGASARLYGVNSLTGIVNIVTKNPKKDGVFAHVYGGTSFKKDEEEIKNGEFYNSRGIQIGGTLVKEKHNHMLFGSHDSGSGYRYNTAFHNNKLFYQGNIVPDENNAIMVLGGWTQSSFGANGFYAAPGDKESEEIVSSYLLNISSTHQLNNRFKLLPSVAYRYNFDDYRYFRHQLDIARSRHYSHSLTSNLRGEYQSDFGKISLGAEMRYEEINSTNIGDHSTSNYGIYTEFQKEFATDLDVNLGAYVNYNTKYGWQVFPGIDASYAFNANWKAVFSAGTSQRIPSFTDLYLDQRPGNIGNPELDPERAYQIEAGGKYIDSRFSAEAFVFYRVIDDFIDWIRSDTDQPYQPYNETKNKTNGVSTSIKYRLGNEITQWNLGLGYTYLSPKLEISQKNLISKYTIENLKHQLVAMLNFKHQNWSATLANRYNQRLSYKSYWINDIRLSYTANRFGIYADAQNIFDATYIEAGAVPMPGRWFTVGIKYNGL